MQIRNDRIRNASLVHEWFLMKDVGSVFLCKAPIIAYGVCKNSFVLNYGLNSPVEGRVGICCKDILTKDSL